MGLSDEYSICTVLYSENFIFLYNNELFSACSVHILISLRRERGKGLLRVAEAYVCFYLVSFGLSYTTATVN